MYELARPKADFVRSLLELVIAFATKKLTINAFIIKKSSSLF